MLTLWASSPGRVVVELAEVELDVRAAYGRSVGFWRSSQTGAVFGVVMGARC